MMTAPLLTRTPEMFIDSNASNKSWGARHGEICGQVEVVDDGGIEPHQLSKLLAAYLAVQCFAKQNTT